MFTKLTEKNSILFKASYGIESIPPLLSVAGEIYLELPQHTEVYTPLDIRRHVIRWPMGLLLYISSRCGNSSLCDTEQNAELPPQVVRPSVCL